MKTCATAPLHYYTPNETGTHGMTRYQRIVQEALPGCQHTVRRSRLPGTSVLHWFKQFTGLNHPAQGVTHALDVRAAFTGVRAVSVMDLIPWMHEDFYGRTPIAKARLRAEKNAFMRGLRKAKARIAISRQASHELEEVGAPATQIAHIPLSESFKASVAPCATRPSGILLVGANEPRKAWENTALVTELTGDHVTWIGHDIGGSWNHEYEEEVMRRLATHGYVRRVRDATESVLAQAYANARYMLVTSRWEGYCLPIAEALYSGCPVVAFDPEGSMDWVERVYGNGIIPRVRSPEEVDDASYYEATERFFELDARHHISDDSAFVSTHREVQALCA